jgi:hypothetical protein
MNKIFRIFVSLFLGIFWMTSCSPDEFSMGEVDVAPKDLVEGIAFKIEHDVANPNIVYLKSLVGSQYTPLWNHPQGRSQEREVTLKIPFAGDYEVLFGVVTRGGIVYGEPVTFTVDDMYAEFISDPLWAMLAGGAGEEKTWYLDLDEDAVSRYFVGPLFFYGVDDSWLTVTDGQTVEGDSWHWDPDYKGNSWLFAAADFGSMTFDLKGGAHVAVEHLTISNRGTERGTYAIDVDNHTMKIVDAAPLHDVNRDGVVIDWGSIKIMSLTENTMQLAVLRDATLSGEDACLLVYNFISKDYKDSWTPGEETEPEPALPDGWKNDVSQTVTTAIKWVLSSETPFNWANLDGSLMNSWATAADYPDWTGFNASVPATYADFSLVVDSKNSTVAYTAPDGTVSEGTYALDDKGFYTFTGITPSFTICGDRDLATSDDNSWRIVKIDKDFSGKISGMWVGVRDAVKPEYFVYYLIPEGISSGGGGGLQGTAVAFDPSKIPFGDFEGNGNLRIEVFNEYGSTKENPGINPADVVFNSGVSVKFTLSGITLKDGAAGSYNASIYFANSSWSPSGNGDNVTVTGDGTYTVTFLGTSSVDALVFVIDIVGLYSDIEDTSNVAVTIDEIIVN